MPKPPAGGKAWAASPASATLLLHDGPAPQSSRPPTYEAATREDILHGLTESTSRSGPSSPLRLRCRPAPRPAHTISLTLSSQKSPSTVWYGGKYGTCSTHSPSVPSWQTKHPTTVLL